MNCRGICIQYKSHKPVSSGRYAIILFVEYIMLLISLSSDYRIHSHHLIDFRLSLVIVNHVRPYQNVSATGARGANDYSNWTFSLTPKYTVIKAGVNEITAKFFCNPNSDVASFYSMNVTGVQAAAGLQGGGGGGQTKMASATSSSTTATVTNQTRTIVSK